MKCEKTKNCTRGYRLNETYHKDMRDVISWRKGLSCMCETSDLHETLEYHQCYIEFVVNQLCEKKNLIRNEGVGIRVDWKESVLKNGWCNSRWLQNIILTITIFSPLAFENNNGIGICYWILIR